jgi:HEPN domain-containing protein
LARGIQAEKDLEKARMDSDWGFYEWACFTAQQAAKKAKELGLKNYK